MTPSETIATLLEREHHHIDQGIAAFMTADGDDALEHLTSALQALRRHIYLEEEMLFPPLRQAGLVAPVFVMLREHGEMWRILDQLEAGARSGAERDALVALCHQLTPLLDSHNLKEEQILYPRSDQVLPEATATALSDFIATGQMPAGWVATNARS